MNRDFFSIGIDIGGTYIKTGIINNKGEIVKSFKTKTEAETNNPEIIYKNISNSLRDVLQDFSYKNDIIGGGIGVPGCVNSNTNEIIDVVNIPSLIGLNLCERLEKEFNIKFFVDNDVNNAARGEYLFGKGKNRNNFCVIAVGTGIGMGIFINGDIYTGHNNYAGEAGHMTIVPEGIPCNCGNYGCWEKYASATTISLNGKRAVLRGLNTSLKNYPVEKIEAYEVMVEAKKGDAIALSIYDDACKYLALGIANIINILNPEALIIGGGISQDGDFLLDRVKYYSQLFAMPAVWKNTEILCAALGNKAGIIGSASLAIMKVKK